ncbi:Uncharacterised protein [Legionella wadsworthii]|uniref:Uncharacterized protein n=1 Tax=Legionella wadsworthii TaxID=28088 RepID=A0A378LQP1_9GAMM|nr:Uncharacterised protein [Legionella wadsworthii]
MDSRLRGNDIPKRDPDEAKMFVEMLDPADKPRGVGRGEQNFALMTSLRLLNIYVPTLFIPAPKPLRLGITPLRSSSKPPTFRRNNHTFRLKPPTFRLYTPMFRLYILSPQYPTFATCSRDLRLISDLQGAIL